MYINLLTYSMVQSPSWEANWFAASQEIPRISRNPKVHYRTHKRPPPVSILDQPSPVHIPTSHLLEIRPNIIHPSTPRFPQWSPSLRFPHQDPIHTLLLTLRATCSAHLILLDFITRTILGEEYRSFSTESVRKRSASHWSLLRKYIKMHGPQNVKKRPYTESVYILFLKFCGPCILIYFRNKDQWDALLFLNLF